MKTSYERRKREIISLYVDPEVRQSLKDLAAATRVSQSDYLREALDDLLKKYKGPLNKYHRERSKK